MKRSTTIILSIFLSGIVCIAQERDSTSLGQVVQSILEKKQLKINGLIQLWNYYQAKGGSSGDGRYYNAFRIRRFELKVSGNVNEHVNYVGMVDFARAISSTSESGRINVIQDAFIELSYFHAARITVGQFLYPLTYEGLLPSSKLDFVERAEITRVIGNQRDIGVQVSGTISSVDYAISVLNGDSQNKIDPNREKDFAGRVVVNPLKEFSFGASGYVGRQGTEGEIPYHRAVVEAVVQSSSIKIFGEGMWLRESDVPPLRDMGGFYLASVYSIGSELQVDARYEFANEHLEQAKDVPHHRATLGVNYFLGDQRSAKVQFNYILTKNSDTYLQAPDLWNNYFYINLQVIF